MPSYFVSTTSSTAPYTNAVWPVITTTQITQTTQTRPATAGTYYIQTDGTNWVSTSACGTYYNGTGTYTPVDWAAVHHVVSKPKFDKSKHRRTRGAIKRALKLMFNVGFEEEARIFLKGSTIEVAHPESLLKFVLKKHKYGTISNKTQNPGLSVPYQLDLYTKCDKHVADLCVYMTDTPVLDQVLALALFIKSGSEDSILEKANWRHLTSDKELKEILALEYPNLRSKLRLDSKITSRRDFVEATGIELYQNALAT